MNSVLHTYILMTLSTLFCLIVNRNFIHPKQKLFVNLSYLGLLVFFMGRLYELARIITGLEIENTFELGFVGITGAFCFWLSSNFKIEECLKIKNLKKYNKKAIILGLLPYLVFLLLAMYNKTSLEIIKNFILITFISANLYFYIRYLLFIKDDLNNLLVHLKKYYIYSIIFCILILLFFITYTLNLNIVLFIDGILLSITMILKSLSLKEGIKKWKI